jgi:hypothetical protein
MGAIVEFFGWLVQLALTALQWLGEERERRKRRR